MNGDACSRLEITGRLKDGAIAYNDVTNQISAPHFPHLNRHVIHCTAHDLWFPRSLINSEVANN